MGKMAAITNTHIMTLRSEIMMYPSSVNDFRFI